MSPFWEGSKITRMTRNNVRFSVSKPIFSILSAIKALQKIFSRLSQLAGAAEFRETEHE